MEVAADRRHLILGTAGHIDHGKTSLIRALTGIDTDRLPEEQRRGMTIELGFASLDIGDLQFGIVDVPGHERFVRTMVAGATGIDVAMICVAADDSVMPQTIEHVEILDLLGIRCGFVAITKCDLVDDDLSSIAAEDVRELLAGTSLESAPIIKVSSQTGEGLDELRETLTGIVGHQPDHTAGLSLPFRMPIDRVFTVAGRGTVVTGSVLSGQVSRGGTLTLWPRGVAARVREVESHGASCETASSGRRAAINLAGIDREDARRGGELSETGFVSPGRILDVFLRCLPSAKRGVKSGARYRLELGTAEHQVRVVLNDISELPGGATGYAQLRSSIPMAATHGQRFILRDENASRTVGGGEILYVAARRFARNRRGEDAFLDTLRHGSDEQRVECVLTAAGFDSLAPLRISALTAVPVGRIESIIADLTESKKLQSIGGSDVRVTNDAINMLAERLNRWLRNHHQRNPDAPGCAADTVVGWLERKSAHGLGRILLDRYLAEGAVKQRGRFVCLPEFAPAMSAQDERLMTLMLDEFRNNRFQPPSPAELGNVMSAKPPRVRKLIEIALASEELVRIDNDMLLHAETEVELREKVATVIKSSNGATVGEIRETLNTTRKYVVPLLEYLDRVGITRRDGDRRYLNHQAAETVDGSKPEVSS